MKRVKKSEEKIARQFLDATDAPLRMTVQRREIISALIDSHDHPSAETLHERLLERGHRVSLATVYRTLSALSEAGLLIGHDFRGGTRRFEQADVPHHDHLIDIDTGAVIEFQNDEIEDLQERVAARLGYELVDHKLELYGRKRKPKGKDSAKPSQK